MNFTVLLIKSVIEQYDISELVGQVEFSDHINKAGCCTFPVMKDSLRPEVGNGVRVFCEDELYFSGNIFKLGFTQDDQIHVTAYDQLRYLKANETYVFQNKTATEAVRQICADRGLKTGRLEETVYRPGTKIFDGKDMLDILADYLKLTLVACQEIFYIKDIAGRVVLQNIRSSISDLMLDPESLMLGFSYERGIDNDSCNKIKLVRDNKQTGKRELYIAQDSNNIEAWGGTLQHYEKLDDDVNVEAAKAKAEALLFLKNRVRQSLSVDVLGEREVRAGNLLYVSLPEFELGKFLLCTAAKHSFTNHAHTVKIDLRLV